MTSPNRNPTGERPTPVKALTTLQTAQVLCKVLRGVNRMKQSTLGELCVLSTIASFRDRKASSFDIIEATGIDYGQSKNALRELRKIGAVEETEERQKEGWRTKGRPCKYFKMTVKGSELLQQFITKVEV